MRARLPIVSAALALCACGKDLPLVDAMRQDGNFSDGGTSSPGIYVTNQTGVITVFAIDATGDAAPKRTITGGSTGLSLPIGIAIDHRDDLFVANRTGSTVTVYPTTANGDVAPSRTLTATGMLSPEGLAIGADDELYVTTCPSCGTSAGGDTALYHFPAGAAAPDRTVTGAATGLTVPGTITVTTAGDVVVGNAFGGTVETFAAAASGDVAPVRSFTPQANNLQSIAHGAGVIAVTTPGDGVDFYDLAATGAATPSGAIPTSASLPLQYPGGIYIDTTASPEVIYLVDYGGNAIYVITTAGSEPALTAASVRTITGPSTQLSGPLDITVAR